jgi:hypothetical protein
MTGPELHPVKSTFTEKDIQSSAVYRLEDTLFAGIRQPTIWNKDLET